MLLHKVSRCCCTKCRYAVAVKGRYAVAVKGRYAVAVKGRDAVAVKCRDAVAVKCRDAVAQSVAMLLRKVSRCCCAKCRDAVPSISSLSVCQYWLPCPHAGAFRLCCSSLKLLGAFPSCLDILLDRCGALTIPFLKVTCTIGKDYCIAGRANQISCSVGLR